MPTIRHYAGAAEAMSVAAFLRQSGVQARVAHVACDAVTGSGVRAHLLVDDRQRDEAERLLREMEAQPISMDQSLEDAAAPDLTRLDAALLPVCPACGLKLPSDAALSACPRCRQAVNVVELIVAAHGPEALASCYPDQSEPIAGDILVNAKLTCPACSYWLEGLAAQGECPECGRPYSKSDLIRGEEP